MSTETDSTTSSAPTQPVVRAQVPARTARVKALKSMDQIVGAVASAKMTGSPTGLSTQQALKMSQGPFAVERPASPGAPVSYVAENGGWTTDPAQALVWHNTADLFRAAHKLNVSGLRIVYAPTPDDIAAQKAIVDAGNAVRQKAIDAKNAATADKRLRRQAAIAASLKPATST